jgi:hypothetical protein
MNLFTEKKCGHWLAIFIIFLSPKKIIGLEILKNNNKKLFNFDLRIHFPVQIN